MTLYREKSKQTVEAWRVADVQVQASTGQIIFIPYCSANRPFIMSAEYIPQNPHKLIGHWAVKTASGWQFLEPAAFYAKYEPAPLEDQF